MSTDSPVQIFNTSGISIPIKESDAIFISKLVQAHQKCEFELIELVFVDEQKPNRPKRELIEGLRKQGSYSASNHMPTISPR